MNNCGWVRNGGKCILEQENTRLKDRDLIIAAELTKLQDENIRLKKESQKQKEVIDKAIEYIKEKQKNQYKFALSHIECDDLLQTLEELEQGSDK